MSDAHPPNTDGVGDAINRHVQHGPIGIGCLLLVGLLLAVTNGAAGLVVGSLVVAIALVATPVVAFSLAIAGLLLVEPNAPLIHGIGALAAVGILAADVVTYPTGWRTLAVSVAAGVVLGGITMGLLVGWSVLYAAAGVSLCVAVTVYVIHRYEQVTLGLVSDTSR